MNRNIIFITLMAGILSVMFQPSAWGQDGEDVVDQNDVNSVTIALTRFDVNDTNFKIELSYKIKNHTNHDVWICDSVNIKPNRLDYEAYVAKDAQILVIRKRFDLPGGNVVLESDFTGRYIRLRPSQERTDSLLVTLPPMTNRFFDAEIGKAKYTKRLALEIGYYDEDLRSLILNTVEVADKLSCDASTLTYEYHEINTRYFTGLLLAGYFNDNLMSYFRDSVNGGDDEILMPPMSWGDIHLGEKVLRLTIDGVYIRCWGEPPQGETEPAGVTTALTGFDVNDTNLKLSFKITNNTDHDVWICESMSRDYPPPLFEQFLDKDAKTLVIRKRFDLPMREGGAEYPPIGSRYVRLRPGEEKVESVFVALPVRPYRMSASNKATNAEYAELMALEIGYYDEDLPALILEIVEISEHLNIDFSVGYHGFRKDVSNRFFGGPIVALLFKGMLGFEPNVRSAEANGEMWMPHFDKVRMGEKVLRLEVDGVSIPYKSNYPPLND